MSNQFAVIPVKEVITQEELEYLVQCNDSTRIKALEQWLIEAFYKGGIFIKQQVSIQFKCTRCGNDGFLKNRNFLSVLHQIFLEHQARARHEHIDYFVCQSCGKQLMSQKAKEAHARRKAEEARRKEEKKEEEKAAQVSREEQTHIFIENYLGVDFDFADKSWRNYHDLCNALMYVNEKAVSQHIRKMSYADFLRTPYWKAIRRYVIHRDNYACALCGNKDEFNVHHKTYEHHGEEAVYHRDLICLCHNCHEKFHGINKEG